MESDIGCSAEHQTHWQDASRWSPKSCICPPARRTRSTELMKSKRGMQKPELPKGKTPPVKSIVPVFFFCCIAELAIKPCRSSRSKLRGEFGIPKHLQNRKQKHNKATNTPNPKHNTKQKEHGKCLECETRGEKRVKRPKRPNALICRTPGGSIRYPLSCSLGMTLISHSIVSIPASPSRFAI